MRATDLARPLAAPSTGTAGCAHFKANPICKRLPAHPRVSPSSAAWSALLFQTGRAYFPPFNALVTADAGDARDGSLPLDTLPRGGAVYHLRVDCDAVPWGVATCAKTGARLQGRVIGFPTTMIPAGNSDHHYAWTDVAKRGEYDLWLAKRPRPHDRSMHVGGAGFCSWEGDGTGCSGADATNIAMAIDAIHAYALEAGEADARRGTLGYAVSTSALCADPTWVYPATYSDGANTDRTPACAGHTGKGERPPEGVRWFLDVSDAQIDATKNAPYVKVLLRTMDREHYGGIVTDTNWSGAPGLTPQYDRGDYSFAAREAGVAPAPFASVPFTLDGIDLRRDVVFCNNGSCT